jgi:hypothetical protein
MSSTRVRAFQPPASSMQALRQTPPVPLKLKKLPVLKRAYCSHLMCAFRQISWYLQKRLGLGLGLGLGLESGWR